MSFKLSEKEKKDVAVCISCFLNHCLMLLKLCSTINKHVNPDLSLVHLKLQSIPKVNRMTSALQEEVLVKTDMG